MIVLKNMVKKLILQRIDHYIFLSNGIIFMNVKMNLLYGEILCDNYFTVIYNNCR